jgi:hypothetical protein
MRVAVDVFPFASVLAAVGGWKPLGLAAVLSSDAARRAASRPVPPPRSPEPGDCRMSGVPDSGISNTLYRAVLKLETGGI